MAAHRSLILATVVGINDGSVMYPCCIQCYAKMLHDLQTDTWHCVRCNMRCTEAELTWRYRLSLCVADTSATCNLSLFGGSLVQHFGCSASNFHRFMVGQHGDIQGIAEEVILHAVQTTLLGKTFIFCLKTSAPPHPATNSTSLPTVSNPLCLARLLRAQSSSQRGDGKLSDFIAVQMVRTGTEDLSQHVTVWGVLKDMVGGSQHTSLSLSGESVEGAVTSQREPLDHSYEGLTHSRRSRLNRQLVRKSCGVCSSLQTSISSEVCADHDGGCEYSQVTSSCAQSSSLSQNSSAGQASLMFSCQSSMDGEFPLGLNLTCTVGTSMRSSSEVNCSQLTDQVATEHKRDFHPWPELSPSGGGMIVQERRIEDRMKTLPSFELERGIARCNDVSFHLLSKPNADELSTDKSTIHEDSAAGDDTIDYSGFESTLPEFSQALTDTNHQGICERSRSWQPCLHLSDIKDSFSASLNDSSLLLGAVEVNGHSPQVSVCVTPGKTTVKAQVTDLSSEAVHFPIETSEQCHHHIVNTLTNKAYGHANKSDGSSNVDMPYSEDLSLFLDGMASENAAVGHSSAQTSACTSQQTACQQKGSWLSGANLSSSCGRRSDRNVNPPESCQCHVLSGDRTVRQSSTPEDVSDTKGASPQLCVVTSDAAVACRDCDEKNVPSELSPEDLFDDNTLSPNSLDEAFSFEKVPGHDLPTKQLSNQLPYKHASPCQSEQNSSSFKSKKRSSACKSDMAVFVSDRHGSCSCMSEKQCVSCKAYMNLSSVQSEKLGCNKGPELSSRHVPTDCSPSHGPEGPPRQHVKAGHCTVLGKEEGSLLILPESEDLDIFLNNLGDSGREMCHAEQDAVNKHFPVDCTFHHNVSHQEHASPGYSSDPHTQPLPQGSQCEYPGHVSHTMNTSKHEEEFCVLTEENFTSVERKNTGKPEDKSKITSLSATLIYSETSTNAEHFSSAKQSTYEHHVLCCAGDDNSLVCPGSVDMLSESGRDAASSFLDGSVDLFSSQGTTCSDKLKCTTASGNSDPCNSALSGKKLPHSDDPKAGSGCNSRSKRSNKGCTLQGSQRKSECFSPDGNSFVFSDDIGRLVNFSNRTSLRTDKLNQNYMYSSSCSQAPQQKKVRFSCKRRISSVCAMDVKLERYTSPQLSTGRLGHLKTPTTTPQRSCVKRAVPSTNTPRRSCLKRAVPSMSTYLQISSGTRTPTLKSQRSQDRPPLSPITSMHNTDRDPQLAACDLAMVQQYSTPNLQSRMSYGWHKMKASKLSQPGLSIALAKQPEYLSCSQENSGSQDLFSPVYSRASTWRDHSPVDNHQAVTRDIPGDCVLQGHNATVQTGTVAISITPGVRCACVLQGHNATVQTGTVAITPGVRCACVLQGHNATVQTGEVAVTPGIRCAGEEYRNSSLFDDSDVLFDNSDNVSGSEFACNLCLCQKPCSCTQKATVSADAEDKVVEPCDMGWKKHVIVGAQAADSNSSVISYSFASFSGSPDLFSP